MLFWQGSLLYGDYILNKKVHCFGRQKRGKRKREAGRKRKREKKEIKEGRKRVRHIQINAEARADISDRETEIKEKVYMKTNQPRKSRDSDIVIFQFR